ncbi:hypothetical protein VSF3289_01375 [Vibrio scophthalmi]|uniref:Uncharacterized protein n=1 Tax=Vibrio scophthalmi TaxID=45658 RepID=A0A1E3WMV4_9VIBR|nr:hypothetical protein VSF3289_01375 [Vibrio scophthalmi]
MTLELEDKFRLYRYFLTILFLDFVSLSEF